MHKVDAMLAEWHRLHKALEQARLRLHAENPSDQVRTQLRQEIDRLNEDSSRALDDAYAALKAELPPEKWEELARAVRPGVTR